MVTLPVPEQACLPGADALRSVHRLAGAILLQAIEDIRHGTGRRRAEALTWMMDDANDDQFSFRFCCRVLGRNLEQVRRWATHIDFGPPSWT